MKKIVTYLVIICVSILLGLTSYEVYHRYDLKERLANRTNTAFLWIQNQNITPTSIDKKLGRHSVMHEKGLFKINETFDISVVNNKNEARNFSVRSNNYGLMSDLQYSFERYPNSPEYRIVIVGDSFTGPTTSTYQWVDTVEEILNQSTELRASVGDKKFKVYNLGFIGAGFNTFANSYIKSGQYFDPNLVLINFIEIDFERTGGPYLTDIPSKVENASNHLEKIFKLNDNVMFTLIPIYNDMLPTPIEYKLTKAFAESDLRHKTVIMRDLMPTNLGADEITSWFNLPYDAHYSDRGGEVYARVLSEVIAKRIMGREFNFNDVKTKYSDIVYGPNKMNTRLVNTSAAKVAGNPERTQRIRDYIREVERETKVFRSESYAWLKIFDNAVDGINIPYYKQLFADFVEVPYDDGPNDFVHLFLSCTSDWISLQNPDCYHHHHLFFGGDVSPPK